MQPDTIRTLAEYIAECKRRNRDNYRATSCSPVNTTLEDNTAGDQGHWSGDGGCDQNISRQGRD